MPELTQESFLGCSIRSFNFNMGWGNSSSVLNVSLVEDDAIFQRMGLLVNGQQQSYVDPIEMIGQLARFDYSGWIFDGIISNITEQKSESGNRVWEVNLTDPRELLDGVQLILSGYNGSTYSVPNLYNVYGYLESFQYGYSEANDAGIPWYKVAQSITTLINGTPMYLSGVPFYIDLSELPSVPNYYRISTNNISLLGFIQDICETANFDFTCILSGNTIRVLTVDRNVGYINGAITRFLQSLDGGYVELNSGYQLQHNTTNKFLVGAPVEQIYYQENSIGPNQVTNTGVYNPTYDDTISRFWGLDANGNVITANRRIYKGQSNIFAMNEEFYVDGKAISSPDIKWYQYPMDLMELRAALLDRGSWENFLALNADFGLHAGKFQRLKLRPDMRNNIPQIKSILKTNIADIVEFDAAIDASEEHEAYLEKVYRFVLNYAQQMGTQFMVKIPFVYSRIDNESGQITNSLQPCDSGYFDESLYNQAVAQGYMPNFTDFVTSPEGKITAYVRFGPFTVEELNLTNLSEDDYYISGSYLFVKCTIDENIVFLDRTTRYSPRVVISLPGPILFTNEKDILNNFEQAFVNEAVIDKIIETNPGLTRKKIYQDEPRLQAYYDNNPTFISQKRRDFQTWKKQVGAEYAFNDQESISLIPSLAAIPLRNNQLTYGPWYSSGFQGRCEFEQNFDMNPWNFGGFANMNRAANAIVSNIYTNSMIGESGDITVPGVPALQPATVLVSGGPMVNQIDVSIGENGVVTTYRLGKWNVTYGKQISENIENFRKIYNLKKEQARAFRALFKPKLPSDTANVRFGSRRSLSKPRRIKSSTSHNMIVCTIHDRVDNKGNNIGMVPYYHMQNITGGEWEKIAGCSVDGIFRPFSTDYNASGIPHFTDPSGYSGSDPTVADLNPYQTDHDIKVAFRGEDSSVPINNSGYGPEDTYRGIALRGPLVIAGYGYDTDGKPVPNENPESPTDSFASGYLQDQENWKCGPLDARWDDSRGVWVAGGGSNSTFFRTPPGGLPAATGSGISLPLVLGSASCYMCQVVNASGEYRLELVPSGIRTVLNSTFETLMGDIIIKADKVDGNYFFTPMFNVQLASGLDYLQKSFDGGMSWVNWLNVQACD